jgi:hypothetical protein
VARQVDRDRADNAVHGAGRAPDLDHHHVVALGGLNRLGHRDQLVGNPAPAPPEVPGHLVTQPLGGRRPKLLGNLIEVVFQAQVRRMWWSLM